MNTFDFSNKEAYAHSDRYNLVLYGNNVSSRRDCIGNTFDALIAYFLTQDEPEIFVNAIMSCHQIYEVPGGYKIIFNRHPDEPVGDMSRDHVFYTFAALKFYGGPHWIGKLELIAKYADKRISSKFRFTRDLWLLMKAYAGSKKHLRRYYRWTWLGSLFIPIWQKAVKSWANIPDEVDQKDFNPNIQRYATKRQIKARKRVLPPYVVHQRCLQLFLLPESKVLQRRRKRLLSIVGKTNYLDRMLLRDPTVRRSDWENYKSMTGSRWSTELSPLGDRGNEIITDPKLISANRIDEDILPAVWAYNYNEDGTLKMGIEEYSYFIMNNDGRGIQN